MNNTNKILLDILQAVKKPDERYWSKKDIAYFFNVSQSTLDASGMLKSERFPKPMRIASGTGRSHPKWLSTEVKKFAKRQTG